MTRCILILAGMVAAQTLACSGQRSARHAGQDEATRPADVVVDIDGNRYPTITIGGHRWTALNLSVTRFRNGDSVPVAATEEEWREARSAMDPAWSHYGNDPRWSLEYGPLYNNFAANDPRGICPEGWRVPTETDWQRLESHLGVPEDSLETVGWRGSGSGDLRSSRTEPADHPRWTAPNRGATNATGFSALPNGYRVGEPLTAEQREGEFRKLGEEATFWSSTPGGRMGTSWGRALWSDRPSIYRNRASGNGFAIRCVTPAERS